MKSIMRIAAVLMLIAMMTVSTATVASAAGGNKNTVATGTIRNKVKKPVKIRKKANSKSAVVGEVSKGTTFRIVAVKGKWYKVEVDSITGFIAKKKVKKLANDEAAGEDVEAAETVEIADEAIPLGVAKAALEEAPADEIDETVVIEDEAIPLGVAKAALEEAPVNEADETIVIEDEEIPQAAIIAPVVKVDFTILTGGRVRLGDTVTLKGNVEGLNGQCSLQWQNSADGKTWNDVSGATGLTHSFKVSRDNYDDMWRLTVIARAA
ncbi:MAG: SH3 domain-containing protein [Clostridia bacterium]|nr:SH3 domain-containing protein [Clostridia bacterium]